MKQFSSCNFIYKTTGYKLSPRFLFLVHNSINPIPLFREIQFIPQMHMEWQACWTQRCLWHSLCPWGTLDPVGNGLQSRVKEKMKWAEGGRRLYRKNFWAVDREVGGTPVFYFLIWICCNEHVSFWQFSKPSKNRKIQEWINESNVIWKSWPEGRKRNPFRSSATKLGLI